MNLTEFSMRELAEVYRILFEDREAFATITIDDVLDEMWRRVCK